MDYSGFRGDDARLLLQAAKAILTADGAQALAPIEEATLAAIQRHLFGAEVDLRALSPRTPAAAEIAAFSRRSDNARQQMASALWSMLTLVDGHLSPAKIAVLVELQATLGCDSALAQDLAALAKRDRWAPKLRIFRRIFRDIFGVGILRGAVQLLSAALGLRDRAIGRRYDALEHLPNNTFGHHLWRFYNDNDMTMAGRWGAYPYEQIGPHDAHHVLSACDTSYEGEFSLLPVECGSSGAPCADFIVTMMLQAHVGILVDPSVKPKQGLFKPDAFFRDLASGARVREDLLARDWDLWRHVERPIDEVRAELRIGPGGDIAGPPGEARDRAA